VHGQSQGRVGMYNDIELLAVSNKIQKSVLDLINNDFDVYITSDHGNTLCVGMGNIKGMGVEVETKSKRMLVLKALSNYNDTKTKYNLIDYPDFYLNKQFKYLICSENSSFDLKDSVVMTHGGISIDEVIVPFITIKAV
jgi:hypothetical protein